MKEGSTIRQKYELRKRIGSEGFSFTWIAENSKNEEEKLVLKFTPISHRDKKRVSEESELLQTIQGPMVVKIFEIFEEKIEGQSYLITVTQYCQEGDFTKLIDLEPSKRKIQFKLLEEVACALEDLHNKNIVHRNIKPENIMIQGGSAKIADFGLARLIKNYGTRMTSASGPPLYMAPEIFNGDSYEQPADVWSLGLIILQVMLGRRLFQLNEFSQMAPCQKYEDLKKFISMVSQYKKTLGELISKMLLVSPKKRATMSEVAQILKQIRKMKVHTKREIKAYNIMLRGNLETYSIGTKNYKAHQIAKQQLLKTGVSDCWEVITLPNRNRSQVRVSWNSKNDSLTFQGSQLPKITYLYENIEPELRNGISTLYDIYIGVVQGRQKGLSLDEKGLLGFKIERDVEVEEDPEPDLPRPQPQPQPDPRFNRLIPYTGGRPENQNRYQTIDELADEIEALQMQKSLDSELLGRKHYKLANLYTYTGLFNKAIEFCQRAISYLEMRQQIDQRDHLTLARAWFRLGENYQLIKKLQMAINCYIQAQEIRKKANLEINQESMMIDNYLGSVYMEMNDLQTAEKYFKKVTDQIKKGDVGKGAIALGDVLKNQGDLLVKVNQHGSAVSKYLSSLDILNRVNGDPLWKTQIRIKMLPSLVEISKNDQALKQIDSGFLQLIKKEKTNEPEYFNFVQVVLTATTKMLGKQCKREQLQNLRAIYMKYMADREEMLSLIQGRLT